MNSVDVVLWWNKDDNNTSDIRRFLFTKWLWKTHQFRKNPNNEEKLGKTLQIPQMKDVKFIYDTSELEIEIELVSEYRLHVVFYPEEHPSDEYQENEWIMEMHIVRYFETSRKFQE